MSRSTGERKSYGRSALPSDPRARVGCFGLQRHYPSIPAAHTFGESIADATANAREIIELELEVARKRGEELFAKFAALVICR